MALGDKVMFKLGTQSSINTMIKNNTGYNVGTFYLTSDSDRLYVGQADGIKLLNKSVKVVETLDKLADLSPFKDDFAYVSGSNVLVVYTGTGPNSGWIQVNPDTYSYITGILDVVAKETNGASISTKLTQTTNASTTPDGYTAQLQGTKVKILGNSNKSIKVEGDAANATINLTGDTYTLSADVAADATDAQANNATITLTSALGQDPSSVVVKSGENVTITKEGDSGFKVSATDTKLDSVVVSGTGDGTGKVTVAVKDTSGSPKSSSINLGYQVGGKDNKKFVGIGTSTTPVDLDVYTTKEVDDKFKTLNPMRYIGTIGGADDANAKYTIDSASGQVIERGSSPVKTIDVCSGDMFLLSGTLQYGLNGTEALIAFTGDLLIASGTENADGVLDTIEWNYVPSGDDSKTDTTYTFEASATENSLTVKEGGKNQAGKIKLVAGTAINVASTATDSNKTLTTTITHADVDCDKPTKGTATLSTANKTFDVVKNIEVNAQGHVTKLETETIATNVYKPGPDIVDTKDKDGNAISNGVQVKHTLIENDDNNHPITNKDAFVTFTSDSLKITSENTGTGVGIELLWGSF